MSVQVSYLKQIILLLMSLVVIIVVVEGIARGYDYAFPDCDLIENEVFKDESHDLKKNICDGFLDRRWHLDPIVGMPTLIPNQDSATININSHGFRGDEFSKEKLNNTFRIFMVGGSTTFAPRAPSDEQSIPGYLQQEMNELTLNREIQVINAGIPNLASSGELLLIERKIIDFEPDLIIIYDGYNDLYLPLGFIKQLPSDEELKKDNFNKDIKKFYKTLYMFSSLIENMNNPFNSFDRELEEKSLRKIENVEQKALLWAENISKICELGQIKGFDTALILQPFLGTGNKVLTQYEKNISMKIWDFKKASLEYEEFANHLNQLELKCTKVLDYRDIFDEIEESVYFDNSHIHYNYNKFVAEKISSDIFSFDFS